MIVRDRIYIDGSWVFSSGAGTIDVVNPATEEVIATVPDGTPEDVDQAVAAARAALPGWSRTPGDERGKFLQRVSELMEGRAEEIGTLISSEMGMPVRQAVMIQAGLPIRTFASQAKLLETYEFEEPMGSALIVKEPVGVVGAITPWNYPLHQIALKVAAALAAGCTVVLKPSEVAPLNAFLLGEIIDEVGLPAGVFNLVSGTGAVVGEAMAAHPGVDMISFTGSTRAGRRVYELASSTIKRVALELGGKSPNVIFEDTDFEAAVTAGVGAAFGNCGQTCTALTRMLVPRSKLADAEAAAKAAAETYKVGDPNHADTRLGPLVSATQLDRVRGYIQKGIDEGAKLVTGGPDAPEGTGTGYYVRPTVFSEVRSDMTIAQEEIFGPVLSIIPFDTEEEAIAIANDTIYGLSGAVSSGDVERAKRVARQIRTGMITVNGARGGGGTPFGGMKQSGKGREAGRYGLEEFLEIKTMSV
jgi:aldehyde dehydrogenase (NAD+)